ncbi:Spartin [Acropora cervicornis]|uniref:Spartin n=1 Tax=Acropora cervicornis TaxID=6130 RepID=A0AAD9QZP0_ACRCE|nr:Spartin [Acropora cervicornis]
MSFQVMERDGPAKVKSQHDEGFRYINEALKYDEQGNTQKALQLYHKGLRNLVAGLSVQCSRSDVEYQQVKQMQQKMTSAPSAPTAEVVVDQMENGCHDDPGDRQEEDENTWEDVKELLVLENSGVTTLSQPQTLKAFQFVNYKPEKQEAPAFLQCGAWMFPMVPGRSPVLNTEPHTYMFPDITIDPTSTQSSNPQPQRAFASVGLILNPNISSMDLQRFERILKCYADFHHYTPSVTQPEEEDADVEGPASRVEERRDEGVSTGEASAVEFTDQNSASRAVAVRPSWGRKVSKGADKLKKHLKPNETPVNVKEETQQNIRQVSGAVVSAVSAMTVQLGRKIAPVIVEKGGKVQQLYTVALKIPGKYCIRVFNMPLCRQYGPQVGEATNNAMGAAGLAFQTWWNVDSLGIKALAKRTAKDTSKEVVKEAEKKYLTDGK